MNDDRQDKPLTTAVIAGREPEPRREGQPPGESARSPLLPNDMLQDLRNRWTTIQSQFVDEPRRAVEHADGLVAEVMKRVAEVFASERSNLEKQWGRNEKADTENLRLGLQRYRSFFDRLLDV